VPKITILFTYTNQISSFESVVVVGISFLTHRRKFKQTILHVLEHPWSSKQERWRM